MATTKIHKIKSNKHTAVAINYILSQDKTNSNLISTFGCNYNNSNSKYENVTEILNDFQEIQSQNSKHKIKARHLIQSFKPNEVSSEEAHKIGIKLCDTLLKDNFQYLLVTHIDKDHIHNHIIFNNVGYDNFCFYDSKNKYAEIQKLSDDLCKEYNLSIVEKNEENNINTVKIYSNHSITNRDELKEIIDKLLVNTDINSLEDLANALENDYNCEVKYKSKTTNKYLKNFSIRLSKAKRFIRLSSLGNFYNTDNLIKILTNKNRELSLPKREKIQKNSLNIRSKLKDIAIKVYKSIMNINNKNKINYIPKEEYLKIIRNDKFLIDTQKKINRINKTSISSINLKYIPEDENQTFSQKQRNHYNNMQHKQAVFDIINNNKKIKFYSKQYEMNYTGKSFSEKKENIEKLLEDNFVEIQKLRTKYVHTILNNDKRKLKKLERIITKKLKETEKIKRDLNTFIKAKKIDKEFKYYSHFLDKSR